MKKHAKSLVSILRGLNQPSMVGAEIGVWEGETSADLLNTFPQLRLLLVDPYDAGPKNETMAASPRELRAAEAKAKYLTQMHSERRQFLRMTSEVASRGIKAPLDFVFIDANHLYEGVLADLRCWYPQVRAGGILMGHDYGGYMDRKGKWGVKPAVDEFAESIGVEVRQERGNVWWFAKPQAKAASA